MLIKVQINQKNRSSVIEVATLFNAKIVNVQPNSLTIQLVGTENDLNNFLELVKVNGIIEVSRTGVIAMGLGE
jgi:acetolactate synthase-1/3 small subunit